MFLVEDRRFNISWITRVARQEKLFDLPLQDLGHRISTGDHAAASILWKRGVAELVANKARNCSFKSLSRNLLRMVG